MIATMAALKTLEIDPTSCTCVIQGFGNVGSVSADLLNEKGVKIIAISDISGGYYDPAGIDVKKAIEYVSKNKSLEGGNFGSPVSNEDLLELPCDILVPAAKEDQITAHNAARIKAKLIVEGANGPISADADDIIANNGIRVIPDILANSGGVIVSYFEWVQDRIGYFWDEDDVNSRLNRMMTEAFDAV
jgi:glutamate dehydrogenase (NAD(P)+)